MKLLAYVVLFGVIVAAQGQVATRIRLNPEGSTLYATVGGAEKKIAEDALKAWKLKEGRWVVYSARDGAGGYENEGQALYLYDASSGNKRKVLSEYFVITHVEGVKTGSGKIALLVDMTDGGLGASHLAVVDPERGEVFSADGVKVVSHTGNAILVGSYHDEDWEKLRRRVKVSPYKTSRYELDDLLRRPVMDNKATR